MTRRLIIVFMVALGPSACARVSNTANGTSEVRAQVAKTMAAFAAMDVEGFKAGLAADVTGFEMDLAGKPIRLGSREEASRFARDTGVDLKQARVHVTLDVHRTDCQAAETLAHGTVEFDVRATAPDGSVMSQPSRNSIVLRKGDDGWTWIHWHSSLSQVATQGHS